MTELQKLKQQKLLRTLLWICLGMFAFSFAMVPFYSLFCKVTGLNGKIDLTPELKELVAKSEQEKFPDRFVTIEFDVTHNDKMPLIFHPQDKRLKIKPGESNKTAYFAKNPTQYTMVIQAIPSITPGLVAKHMKKIECFCFQRQVLRPGEAVNMPIKFIIDPKFPTNIHRFTLSYTLFELEKPTLNPKEVL